MELSHADVAVITIMTVHREEDIQKSHCLKVYFSLHCGCGVQSALGCSFN